MRSSDLPAFLLITYVQPCLAFSCGYWEQNLGPELCGKSLPTEPSPHFFFFLIDTGSHIVTQSLSSLNLEQCSCVSLLSAGLHSEPLYPAVFIYLHFFLHGVIVKCLSFRNFTIFLFSIWVFSQFSTFSANSSQRLCAASPYFWFFWNLTCRHHWKMIPLLGGFPYSGRNTQYSTLSVPAYTTSR